MQTCHQPDIENIKAIFTRLSNRNGPARPPQEQELPMRDREDPAIGQVDLKWDERLASHFEIHLADGRVFPVPHREFLLLGGAGPDRCGCSTG